ncbi:MAG: uroporphyrinogen-III C-methyltransferase [Acidobacteria bacterium]|nr:uroporphyrinogen-III C-methyltransferase [Acidobacteriota bacterium]
MRPHFVLPGKVYLVGAGPGSAKLLTLRAVEVLRAADLVLHDDLVSEEVLGTIPSRVAVQSVGKRCGVKKVSQENIHSRMISAARSGQAVIRLKGGDPLVFGRTQEEITALRAANIEFEIIPGITSATAAAAAAQIPLTERTGSSKLVFVSNHGCVEKKSGALSKPIADDSTLVFYMPGSELGNLGAELRANGLPGDIPCLLVSHVALPGQKLIRTTIKGLPLLPAQQTPTLLIVGSTVSGARFDENLFLDSSDSERPSLYKKELLLDLSDLHEPSTTKLAL